MRVRARLSFVRVVCVCAFCLAGNRCVCPCVWARAIWVCACLFVFGLVWLVWVWQNWVGLGVCVCVVVLCPCARLVASLLACLIDCLIVRCVCGWFVLFWLALPRRAPRRVVLC